jgi:hypothetical protein
VRSLRYKSTVVPLVRTHFRGRTLIVSCPITHAAPRGPGLLFDGFSLPASAGAGRCPAGPVSTWEAFAFFAGWVGGFLTILSVRPDEGSGFLFFFPSLRASAPPRPSFMQAFG